MYGSSLHERTSILSVCHWEALHIWRTIFHHFQFGDTITFQREGSTDATTWYSHGNNSQTLLHWRIWYMQQNISITSNEHATLQNQHRNKQAHHYSSNQMMMWINTRQSRTNKILQNDGLGTRNVLELCQTHVKSMFVYHSISYHIQEDLLIFQKTPKLWFIIRVHVGDMDNNS